MTNRTLIPAFPQRREGATPGKQRGFTLIELIIFIIVVSMGLAGILAVFNTVVKSSADPMVRKQSIVIAESLLEEILLKAYANPVGGYTGTLRIQFDNVSDYNGYSTTFGIQDVTGLTVNGLTSYNISPPVAVSDSNDLTGVAAKKVTVYVTDSNANTISFTGYRAKDQ